MEEQEATTRLQCESSSISKRACHPTAQPRPARHPTPPRRAPASRRPRHARRSRCGGGSLRGGAGPKGSKDHLGVAAGAGAGEERGRSDGQPRGGEVVAHGAAVRAEQHRRVAPVALRAPRLTHPPAPRARRGQGRDPRARSWAAMARANSGRGVLRRARVFCASSKLSV